MVFRCKNLLVTGGAGFIGSNFINYILSKYLDLNVINIDNLTYAGSLKNTKSFENNKNYNFVKGDICDKILLENIFDKYKVDGVINFAAETHVDNSIKEPTKFIQSNIIGTHNLLNACFKSWFDSAQKVKSGFEHSRFHQISTDEVYGSTKKGCFDELSPYNPNSPYSASKASSDMLVRSYNITFGLDTTISICSNNFGANQHEEKLLPKLIKSIHNKVPITIYGNGLNQRDWIYVIDHCKAVDLIFNKGKNGEKYNIGSGIEISNLELVRGIYKIYSQKENIQFIKDRHGHDFRYSINSEKIMSELNWSTSINIFDYFKKYKK